MSDQKWKLLTAADSAPVEPPPFVLRAGLTPTWSQLREGRFAERAGIFESLWKSFNAWRASHGAIGSEKLLPVFWIEGGPGDGKSVLLLQLMAECLRQHIAASIAWLEHSTDGRAFQERPPAGSGWYFCAEIPTRAEGVTRDEWMPALSNAGAGALVTSGSSEVRHGFEFRFENRAKVIRFVLPPFAVAETNHFAEWLQAREGVSRDAAALWREGMSLTEFLFALQHGKPLADLTSDVRGALGNLGLGGRVRSVWLANALGLRVPAKLLASELAQNHAAKLAERGIVPVEISAGGLQLAPPAIAWPMVGTWLGKGHELHHLCDALAFVLKAWLEAGDEENALRFLHQLWGTEWLTDERPVGHGNSFVQLKRRDVLRELYRIHRRDFNEQPAPATIPVWLELNEAFSLMLLPDPVACAAELFSKPENERFRRPLLAAQVWLAADSRRKPLGDDARKIIGDYFLAPMDGPGAGRALMRLVRDTKKLPEARRVAETWLKLLPDHHEALDVTGALVKRARSSDEFLAWVMECFTQPSEVRPGAAKLLTAMLEGRPHDEVARQRATAWAWSHALEPQTGILWRTLLMEGLAKEDVLRGAARWLAANATHTEADALRTRVLKHYPQAFEAAWVMQEWLRDHSADETAADWLLKLLETQPNNRKASALALEWVGHSLAHPASPKMLRLLFKHPDLEVQAVAERWLDANPDSSSHAELLSVIIRNMRSVPKWMERGEAYVGNPQRPGREHIIASLLAAHDCQPCHVRMALQLLPELRTSSRTFLETALGRSLARNLAQAGIMFRQLAGTPQALDLAHVLSRGLAQFADLHGEFVRLVLPVMDREAASQILFHLVRADVRSPEIISTLVEWLQKNYRQQGYTSLLAALKSHSYVWKHLLGTQRLDQRVIADHKNFRNRPSEQIGSHSNITGVGMVD